jgi:precorrin-8X/cobalt-precorrin-8 methylmutase
MHVTKDIPDMIEEARNLYPALEFVYSEPLGVHNKLVQVVLERIYSANRMKPEQIETRSFDIISEEDDFSGIPSAQLPIIKRVIHATADYEFKESMVFHPDAVNIGLKAIKSGKDILTDVEMVKTGINKKLLAQCGGKVICGIQSIGDSEEFAINKTRAAAGIEAALAVNNNIGIVAIGNAPTALIKIIELLLKSNHEILVIGVPVGFVNALESKILLATQKFPFITNLSRKGGSPVAVAIVNALLKMAGEG